MRSKKNKGSTDLDIVKGLLESERHATADDQSVNLVEHVLNQLNLVGDLGTTKDGKEGPFGVLKDLSKVLELLLHEEASSSLGELDTDHGGVGSVGGTEADSRSEQKFEVIQRG